MAPKNGKCDFPTLQGTPFLLSPDIQQANRASMVLQRNNQDQTCSCHFSNSLANPGSREIRKILLSFLNYQQIEIQLTMTVSTRPLCHFSFTFHHWSHGCNFSTLLPKTRVPLAGRCRGSCRYPTYLPLLRCLLQQTLVLFFIYNWSKASFLNVTSSETAGLDLPRSALAQLMPLIFPLLFLSQHWQSLLRPTN